MNVPRPPLGDLTTALQGDDPGSRRAIARLISQIEDDPKAAQTIIEHVHRHTGQAHVIGITGAPGSGKSSLVARIAVAYRRRDMTVAIVAVDPTSPFSGGAILGDRIRAQALSGDSGVFFRSMATRGSLGGLARATGDVVALLDACGYARILVETVGAGQSEVDIASAAHTTLVLQTPGAGDEVQTLKAGILEIADILVVNKADLDGAMQMANILAAMLDLDPKADSSDWSPSIVLTSATRDEGIHELVDAIEEHVAYLSSSGRREAWDRRRAYRQVGELLQQALWSRCLDCIGGAQLDRAVDDVVARRTDPYSAVKELLATMAHIETTCQT
jgi:LAO/AO transport system kinase